VNSRTQNLVIQGPAGALECAIDQPDAVTTPQGMALLCHPHPLHGGTMDNKVVTTLARAFVQCGWRAVRFNFRGVGKSEGHWGEGVGEVDDARAVLAALRQGDEPLAVAGFSFGGYVASQLSAGARVSVLIAPATQNFTVAIVPAGTLVVHGEADDVVPLAATMDWARPQSLPVTVIPAAGHFFHGQLQLLKHLVVRHLWATQYEP
jgi:alpha/beta superfamily hydrolase